MNAWLTFISAGRNIVCFAVLAILLTVAFALTGCAFLFGSAVGLMCVTGFLVGVWMGRMATKDNKPDQ